ncbi:MAG: hypothetical protein WC117_01000 [Sphaerochaetaceae bacterium]
MEEKRVRIITGHYGSGKTSIAIKMAFSLHAAGRSVTIADLDIVNPYFRTSDEKSLIEDAGIRVVCSAYNGSTLDIPALPKQMYGAIADRQSVLVIDVGGDDRGAVALGRFAPDIISEGSYEMIYVVNFYRPLTRTAAEAFDVMREIEKASGIRCTCIMNNSNLGIETADQTITATEEAALQLCALSGLPLMKNVLDEREFKEERYGRSYI